jgi:hypothetical protein
MGLASDAAASGWYSHAIVAELSGTTRGPEEALLQMSENRFKMGQSLGMGPRYPLTHFPRRCI